MIVWNPKDPGETVAYSTDWTDQLAGDAIASYTFTVVSGNATIASQTLAGSVLTFVIAGGAANTTTTFLNTVTTAGGQILERHFSLYAAANADSFHPATTTKRMLVDQMFNEVALNNWELDISPDEQELALKRLDALMWELKGRGVDLGYNFPTAIGSGSLSDALGAPDQAFFGLAVLGAQRLCATMGKTFSKESRETLATAMKAVRAAAFVLVPSVDYSPGTPVGAGNRWTFYPFVQTN